jgi:tetratricopeptide (TPR) repeat protein
MEVLIENDDQAYALSVKIQQLVMAEKYAEALKIGEQLLHWAKSQRDVHLELSLRNHMAICNEHLNYQDEAVLHYQKGIQLADSTRNPDGSLKLRFNLAKFYIKEQKYQAAHDVLITGIGYCQLLLSEMDGSEFRQEIIAGSVGLFELYVFIMSLSDHHGNRINVLAMTETVRCQNLLRWLEADYLLESSAITEDMIDTVREQIQIMRAVEVELEVRHLTHKIGAAEIALLRKRRTEVENRIKKLSLQLDLPIRTKQSKDSYHPFEDIEIALEAVIEKNSAIVCFFCIPEGISSILVYRKDGEIQTKGRFIAWDQKDRRNAFANWTGDETFLSGRGQFGSSVRSFELIKGQMMQCDIFYKTMTKNLMDPIVGLLDEIQPVKVTVVPHAELALIPYWPLVDRCPSITSFSVVPSVSVLRMCLARNRSPLGRTVVVPDLSDTLIHTQTEISAVVENRVGCSIIKTKTIDQLSRELPKCAVLHVAAHGLFNQDNPYHSGFLAGQGETAEGLFVQYADIHSHKLLNKPSSGKVRLMTVAECMAHLSLKHCRLAVLSTCESGIPRQHGGGELTGLPNSLLVAGAKSVIASLWEVNDAATAMLMHYFYDTWKVSKSDEMSPAHALVLARKRLQSASRNEVNKILGIKLDFPPGELPFKHPLFSDAFQCFGSC